MKYAEYEAYSVDGLKEFIRLANISKWKIISSFPLWKADDLKIPIVILYDKEPDNFYCANGKRKEQQ
jgi:hypothetical protein